MDYNSLSELTSIQRDEMLSLLKDPTGVPTIMNLAAFGMRPPLNIFLGLLGVSLYFFFHSVFEITTLAEYQRLENLLEYMRAARMDLDGEGSLIGRISLAFGLKDAPSIEHFVNRLKDEIKTFNDFKQRFPCISWHRFVIFYLLT